MTSSFKQQSSNARTNILAKLKQEVEGSDYSKLPEEPSYSYPELAQEELLAQFIGHLEANHAQVIPLKEEDIAKIVSEQLKQRGISKLLYGKNALHSEQMLTLDDDIAVEAYDFTLKGNKEHLFNNIPAGITSSKAAIAATGSIVIWPTIEEPRSLSLVPPLHFVIVEAKNLYTNFASLINAQEWQNKLPTNAVLISGPSKTADIQQTLAYGAHGPKELIVLLLK